MKWMGTGLQLASRPLPAAWWYVLITAAGVLLFLPTWIRLASIWLEWEQVMAHGLPTAIIYLYLLFTHPPKLQPADPGSVHAGPVFHLAGAILLVVLTLVWSLLESVRIDTLAYLCLPAGLLLISWTLLGVRAALAFLPYVVLLGLAIPLWSDLIPGLVALAAAVVGYLVSLLGITALIEGHYITLPYGRLEIADGCSGIGYLAISLLLGALLSILNDFRWKGWLAALALATLVALLVNWIRILVLVVVAYSSRMQSGLVSEHELFGWLLYGLAVVPAIYFAPVRRRGVHPAPRFCRVSLFSLIPLLICMMAGQGAIQLARSGSAHDNSSTHLPEPLEITDARPLMPLQLPPEFSVTYAGLPDSDVIAVVSRYRRPSADAKIVPYLAADRFSGPWFREPAQQGNLTVWQNPDSGQRVLVKNLYTIGPYTSDSYRGAKLLQLSAIFQGDTRFLMISFQIPCQHYSCQPAAEKLRSAVTAFISTTRAAKVVE